MASDLRVYRSVREVPADFGPSAMTIGNFDGVHIGHQHLFERVVEVAAANGWRPSVLTFDPHPTRVLAPERAPRMLTTIEQRLELMRNCGIQQVVVLPFDAEFAQLSPEEFVRKIIIDTFGARAILVGDNFRFGCKQAGDVALLREFGARFGFTTDIIEAIMAGHRKVSSTEVRRAIGAGEVSVACRILGRPYVLEGEVVRGHGIGSKQTVPTLNLATTAEVMPANGVYITETVDLEDGRRWPSITNVGMRPTFEGDRLTVETFLLAPLQDPTPARIRVAFWRRVRDERKFESPEALKTQILKDVGRAQTYWRRRSRWVQGR